MSQENPNNNQSLLKSIDDNAYQKIQEQKEFILMLQDQMDNMVIKTPDDVDNFDL